MINERFYRTPDNASAGLVTLIADLREQDSLQHFMNKLVVRVGEPKWSHTEEAGRSKGEDTPADVLQNSVMNEGQINEQIFEQGGHYVIPFVHSGKQQVAAFLVARATSTGFRYRLFRRKWLDVTRHKSPADSITREIAFAVFGHFEKQVHGKDTIKLGPVHDGRVIRGARFRFLATATDAFNQHVSEPLLLTGTSDSQFEVCYIPDCNTPIQSVDSEVHDAERNALVSCPPFICTTYDRGWIDGSGSGGTTGEGSGGSSSDGGGTGGGYQCPQTEPWCDAGLYDFYNGVLYTIEDYPGMDNGFEFGYWRAPSTQAETNAINDQKEEFAPVVESPCHSTMRFGGGPNFQGTMEHMLIQLQYFTKHPFETGREFMIPHASKNDPTKPGYADLVNTRTGEIFEIKTPAQLFEGRAEVNTYVQSANTYCGAGKFQKGYNYSCPIMIYPGRPTKGMKVDLREAGVLVYEEVDQRPQPVVIAVPSSVTEKLRQFISNMLRDSREIELQIREFLRQNPELVTQLKTAVAAAGAGLVVAALLETYASGGALAPAGIAHLMAGYRIVRFAMAL